MKSLLVKTLVLSLAVIFVLSLAACGAGNSTTAETSTEVQTTEAVSSETKTAPAETEAAATEAKASDTGIVGTWEYEYGGFTYTFNADGTGTYDMFGDALKFSYEISDTTVSIQYEGSDAPMELAYTLDGDVLNIKDSAGNDTIYNRK